SIEGQSLLDDAIEAGRGVLVLVPHLGNWELFALRFGEYGFVALYDPPRDPELDTLVRTNRERTGATLLPIDSRGFRSLLSALRSGRPVSLLPDQVPERSAGLYAPFFSQPALTMTFVHRLVRRWRPRVLMGACLRTHGGFEIRFSEPDPDIYADDAYTSVTAMNRSIEALVREAPAQYQWEYKRFKRPPPGTPDRYRG
ncbi:MAG: lipid A biosynthesis lauroyl acyltransferase, partial [Alphaproteobacteria bacterium]